MENQRIMSQFSFFGDQEHRVFNHKPIYYDKEAEERRRMFGAVDGSLEKDKQKGTYVPGSYIKGSMRGGNFSQYRTSGNSKLRVVIGIVSLILVVVILIFIAKFVEIVNL